MVAYLIGKMHITDVIAYDAYKALTPDIVHRFNGRFLTRGGEKYNLEGLEETRRVVIVEFPSMTDAKHFYESIEYTHARSLRRYAATNVQLFLVEGFEAQAPYRDCPDTTKLQLHDDGANRAAGNIAEDIWNLQ